MSLYRRVHDNEGVGEFETNVGNSGSRNPKNATLYEEMADTMATMGGKHVESATLYYRETGVL